MIKNKLLKKVITMLLIIVSCLTFLVNSSVRAEIIQDKLNSMVVKTPTSEEVKEYIKAIIEYTSDWAVGMRPEWDQMLNNPEYNVNFNSLENTNLTYHYCCERAALYLIDAYKKTGSDDLKDLDKWWDIAEMTALQNDKDNPNYNYGDDTLEKVSNEKWNELLNNTSSIFAESKNELDDEKNQKNEAPEKEETEEEKKIYTIEDLVFNHIAALDPNVFSQTAGGQPVIQGSAIDKIREAIATWYVSLRNVAFIALFIIIVYIGIRMAIATSASAKADYKGMMMNWLTALLIICVIHFIMIIVLNINDSFVTLLSQGATSEEPIYETIRTRTWDLRVSVGFPAAVIYIVLFIFYIKFMWVYIKRLFTLLILIAIAPLIGVKYAIDSAKTGKKAKAFSDWLYDFTMNVLLQSMHALIYAAIMPIAIELSTKSVIGYIIGLVFINFILKADKIFMNIFNFNKSKTATENAEPMKEPKKEFGSVVATAASAAVVAGTAKDIVEWGGRKVKKAGRVVYRSSAKLWDEYHEGNVRKRNKERKNKILNKYDNAMNAVHKALTGEDSKYRVLSVMSRQKNSLGRAAKKQLKKAKASRKKKYSAPFKFVKSSTGNALKIAFGIPAMVVNPGVGSGMIMSGITGNIKMGTATDDKGNKYEGKEAVAQFMTLGVYGTQKEIGKSEQKVDKAVGYLKDINNKEEDIRKSFKDTFGEKDTKEAKQYKKDMSYMLTFAEKENIHMLLRERLNVRAILKIDDNNVDKTIDSMVDDISKEIGLEDRYTDKKVKEIRKKMAEKAKEIYKDTKLQNAVLESQASSGKTPTSGTQNTSGINQEAVTEPKEFGAADMAKGFAEAIMEEGITRKDNSPDTVEKYKKLTKEIMDLHDINKKAQKDLKTSVLRETEFIKSLNRKKGSTDSENRFI